MTDYHDRLVLITDSNGNATIALKGTSGQILAGGNGKTGDIRVRDGNQLERIWLMGTSGDVIADNDLWIGPTLGPGIRSLVFDGSESELTIFHKSSLTNETSRAMRFRGKSAHLQIGDNGNSGEMVIRDGSGREGIRAQAKNAFVRIGSAGNKGRLLISDENGTDRFHLDGDGYIEIRDDSGEQTLGFNSSHATLVLGQLGNPGRVAVYGGSGSISIDIDGSTGDIRLHGADCAENFDVEDSDSIDPGSVLVIGEDQRLVPCTQPYDRKVAGIISGAGELAPGVILDGTGDEKGRLPVALTGKVHCKVDASESPIETGDLLTTSGRRGYAMKACDREKAFGAVLGKALAGFREGQGLLPVLVALQ